MQRDFVVSHLRSQLNHLNALLSNIEDENKINCDYAKESLKEIEIEMRQIRKLCN